MGDKVPIPKAELARLYYEEGCSLREIGAHFGVSRVTIKNRMVEYGMETRPAALHIPRATLVQLYHDEGLTQAEVAERLGVHEATVRHRMQDYGIETRRQAPDISEEELAYHYYQEGLTQTQIAELYDTTGGAISYLMRKYGMETRTVADYRPDIPAEMIAEMYYEKGMPQAEIGEAFGVSAGTICHRMAEYGMETRSHADYKYIDIPKEELQRLYVDQELSVVSIAELYGCSINVVYSRIAEHGIEMRPAGWDKLKAIVPDARLEWSRDLAYAIGLVATDGNLRRDANEVKFYSTDHELTENYCRALGLRPDDIPADQWDNPEAVEVHVYHDTRHEEYKPQYHVVFSDYRYRALLEGVGLTPNKSNTMPALHIGDEYFQDFLRGVFDGDGCWCVSRGEIYGIITSGSPEFRTWLQQTIWRLTPITTGTIYNIDVRFQGRAAEALGQYIYYEPGLPCLSRKRAIWQRWMDSKK